MNRAPLPIDAVLPQLVDALRRHSSVVLRAPTGAGKTTRVPPALLDSQLTGPKQIVLLEPRRLAARAAARRMAAESDTQLGETIGFHVRFERKASSRTRILVVTPGILLRMLHDDPYLERIGVIIFDEFHERSLENDLALGIVRLLQQSVRPELKIVVLSATIDTDSVAAYLDRCPVVVSEGRLFPVEIVYHQRANDVHLTVAVASAVRELLDQADGDLLVFLPGLGEIRQTARHLEPLATERDLAVLPLHGDLPSDQQDAALLAGGRRKVVLATNVAETSVTVEGITGVVDSGLARQMTFDPAVGIDRLKLMPISRSSADQRAGRAGRTRPGICIRLWSAGNQRSRPEQTEPEIRRVDLAGAMLHLLALGETDVLRFPWFDPPPMAAVHQASELLQRLGAIDTGSSITELGKVLARLPVHPRLGRLLLEGHRFGQAERVALAAALLSERDPFARSVDGPPVRPDAATASDLLDRVEALEGFETHGRGSSHLGTLNRNAARFVLHARDQLLRTLRQEAHRSDVVRGPDIATNDGSEAFLRSILAAFPDRLARRREAGSPRGVMVGGRGVRLAPTSAVTRAKFFICVNVDAGQRETLVRQASAVEREWLPVERRQTAVEVLFDAVTERVTATRRVCFDNLVIDETMAHLPDDDTVAHVLADAANEQMARVLPADDSPAGMFLIRLRCLRTWMPELALPEFDEAELREVIPWLCRGCRSFDDLRKAPWLVAIHGRLTHQQRQTIEQEAPERLLVPSGSRLALRYEVGRPPILAVRIQELFGLRETPRIAAGRVPVLLHLLAPNFRPQQVTDDLASFWTNTYPIVRKELRARYPKHAWPEDPWTALPQRRAQRRD